MRSPAYLYSFTALFFVVLYCYYEKVSQIVYIPVSDPYLSQFWSKTAILLDFNSFVMDGRMDRRTDRPTDGHTLLKRCENASKNYIRGKNHFLSFYYSFCYLLHSRQDGIQSNSFRQRKSPNTTSRFSIEIEQRPTGAK